MIEWRRLSSLHRRLDRIVRPQRRFCGRKGIGLSNGILAEIRARGRK